MATLTAAAPAATARRTLGTSCGAHALHDGCTDLITLLLPLWQAAFGLSYAEIGLLRSAYSTTMGTGQIPSGTLAARIGSARTLALGTAVAGAGFAVAAAADGFATLLVALAIAGAGASVQHPVASELVARAFAGARSRVALGTYNFAGDLGKMAIPAAGALMVTMLPWRVTLALIGAVGLVVAVALLLLAPRYRAETAQTEGDKGGHAVGGQGGFYALLSIGVIDSATRMGLLTFLPFLLTAKGASLPTIGFALTLVFVGGAVGKLVCAWIGARIGVVATVWLTEGLTALGILALIVLPLEFALMLLPVVGVALNGTSSVLYGSVPLLVSPEARARAFSIFYTGAIGSGAVAPIFYGLIGDAVGVPYALIVIAATVLVTLPLVLALKGRLAAASAA